MLILARMLQGVGGGALQPISQAILLECFPPQKRGVAMAVFGLGVVVAPIIGPTLGGWITDNYSWRWIFYINLPVGILALMLIQMFIQDPPYIRGHAPAASTPRIRPAGPVDRLASRSSSTKASRKTGSAPPSSAPS